MKSKNLIRLAPMAAMFSLMPAGLSARAALLNLGQNPSSPYYADFTANGLDVNYDYDCSTQTGTFTVSNPHHSRDHIVPKGDAYTSRFQSPGTHGAYNETGFSGSFTLTADISYNSGAPTLTSGSFAIYGELLGGTTSSLLLGGNLIPGAGGTTFGYVDHTAAMSIGEYNEFDFLINLSTLTGNPQIEADFLKNVGGIGGIIVNANFDYTGHRLGGKTVYDVNNGSTSNTKNTTPPPTSYGGFQGYWNQDFANPLAAGSANAFVPEPAAYPWAACIAMLLSCAGFVRRRLAGVKAM